jgi:hypothetical protein
VHTCGSGSPAKATMMPRSTVPDGTRGKKRAGDGEPYKIGLLGERSVVSSGSGGVSRPGFDGGGRGVAPMVLQPPNSVEKLRQEVLILLLGSNPDERRWINAHKDLPWWLGFQALRMKFNLV